MSLLLDARQRAMLLEMGVRVWQAPGSSAAIPAAAVSSRVQTSDARHTQPAEFFFAVHGAPSDPAAYSSTSTSTSTSTATPSVVTGVPQSNSKPAITAVPTPVDVAPASAPQKAEHPAWTLQPLRVLYPQAPPDAAPLALGAGWLLVTPAVDPNDPRAEGAERLLTAMLHALQLHRHPRVALCALEGAATGGFGGAAITTEIATQVAAFAPSVVLVMGRSAIRAALGQSEPLGKLRAQDLRIAGVPAIATYDAPFLLRNPLCKRPAWIDLCRARAIAGTLRSE